MKSFKYVLAASAVALAAGSASAETQGYGDCPLTGERGTHQITPAVPGQFTVLVNLPAVGQFNGNTPDTITDGYEFCMAVNIAHRLGLDTVKLVNASFDSIVAGQNNEYDIALALISVTAPRDEVVDFSEPYAESNYGVAAQTGSTLTEDSIKDARIGVQAGTTLVPFAQNELGAPTVNVFDDTAAMFTAGVAGTVDAVMTDLGVVLGQVANSRGKLEVIGRYATGGLTAGVYPEGSDDAEVIDEIIRELKADGTLKELESAYLLPSWGGVSPDDVPVWNY